jgi:hypothetical protein
MKNNSAFSHTFNLIPGKVCLTKEGNVAPTQITFAQKPYLQLPDISNKNAIRHQPPRFRCARSAAPAIRGNRC